MLHNKTKVNSNDSKRMRATNYTSNEIPPPPPFKPMALPPTAITNRTNLAPVQSAQASSLENFLAKEVYPAVMQNEELKRENEVLRKMLIDARLQKESALDDHLTTNKLKARIAQLQAENKELKQNISTLIDSKTEHKVNYEKVKKELEAGLQRSLAENKQLQAEQSALLATSQFLSLQHTVLQKQLQSQTLNSSVALPTIDSLFPLSAQSQPSLMFSHGYLPTTGNTLANPFSASLQPRASYKNTF